MSAPQRMANLMCDQHLKGLRTSLQDPKALAKWFQDEYLIVDQTEGPIPEYQLAERVQLDEGKQAYAASIWKKLHPNERALLVKIVEEAAGPAAAAEFTFEVRSR